MIQNKKDYKSYVDADNIANHFNRKSIFLDDRCKYLHVLRKLELMINIGSNKFLIFLMRQVLYHYSVKLGITIPPNVFGKGLYIPHYGSIVVNGTAKFGDNCIVQNGVNVSESVVCGGGCYIGAGAKLLIGVHLADNIIVGANAVVTKSFEESNIVIAGIPAKKISDKGMSSGRNKV